MLKRDWFDGGLRQRAPIVLFIFTLMMAYFPINMFNAGRGGQVPRIGFIDDNIPLIPIFVTIYVFAFFMFAGFFLLGAMWFPRDLFQEYSIAFCTMILVGFTCWLLFPAYIVKEPITADGFFADWLRQLHGSDDNYGVHNALPSSHVYYITISMIYFFRWRQDRWLVISFSVFAVLNALSTLFTHQHYFIDAATGFVAVALVYAFTVNITMPWVRKMEQRHRIGGGGGSVEQGASAP